MLLQRLKIIRGISAFWTFKYLSEIHTGGDTLFLSAQIHVFGNILGFPGGSNGFKKKSACNARDPGLISMEDPWRKEWQPTPVFLPEESHRQRSLVGYSLWGCKESDMTEQLTLSLLVSKGTVT